jgi:hypothetical protein
MSDAKRANEQRRDYGEQDEWGNSIASLRANLKLTPIERIRKAEQSQRELNRLLNAIKRID